MGKQIDTDILVIGSGAAGLSLALHLADLGRVAVIAKESLTEGCTLYAQGGIAAVLNEHDSTESHVEDTLNAGTDLCKPEVVRFAVEHGRESVERLIQYGVPFTRGPEDPRQTSPYHLTREGGHTHRRVIHAADATGRAMEMTLTDQIHQHSNITTYDQHIVIDLITAKKLGLASDRCLGAYVLNKAEQRVDAFRARFVVLATGGASKVYLYTTNPDVSTGDGIAMAWRAGCRVANMEFIQFHPTCLYHPKAKTFLITEAVRGEGGKLTLPDGSSFIQKFDPRAELASRDIVARAIDHEMKRTGSDHVNLDISFKPANFIIDHFPTIYAHCLRYGIDITREPIPVVPAAHYTCGGVITDINGRSDIEGLYAIGETASTGLHGANRLASNSLLECMVFAESAANDIRQAYPDTTVPDKLPPWDESRVTDSDEEVVVSHNWDELRRFMWDYVGIVRTTKRLQRAQHRADLLSSEISEYYGNFRVTNDLIELRNLTQVSSLIIRSALLRKESRGLHYTLNYPQTDTTRKPQDTILVPENFSTREKISA